MMSADPFVQDPMNAQAWNRYSYAFGDPPHDIIERHQARDPLPMLQGGDHAGYVAAAGARGQEGHCGYARRTCLD